MVFGLEEGAQDLVAMTLYGRTAESLWYTPTGWNQTLMDTLMAMIVLFLIKTYTGNGTTHNVTRRTQILYVNMHSCKPID